MIQDQDQISRRAILDDLDANFMVEAGAGSGKTECLVARFVRLLAREGGDTERVVAITFTRKAADEMKGRIQVALETAIRQGTWGYRFDSAPIPPKAKQALSKALANLERLRVGTIHAFCTGLLKARPFEAGVDPLFTVLEEGAEEEVAVRGLRIHLAQHTDDASLARLLRLSVNELAEPFLAWTRALDEGLEIVYEADAPDLNAMGAALKALRSLAASTRQAQKDGAEDPFHSNALVLDRANPDPKSAQDLGWALNLLGGALGTIEEGAKGKFKQGDSGVKKGVYEDGSAFQALLSDLLALNESLNIGGLVTRWQNWRHAQIHGLFGRAAANSRSERLRSGQLTYQDLLTASLKLTEIPAALASMRLNLGALLMDEFQDTDPLQWKLALALTSTGPIPKNWTKTTLRPGALFLVGDPKQSIYAFRRADIQLYLKVKAWANEMAPDGPRLLSLTRNYRSYEAIIGPVNRWGQQTLLQSDWQAPYTDMQAQAKVSQKQPGPEGVFSVNCDRETSAAQVASLVQTLILGKVEPREILILTPTTTGLPELALALEGKGIAYDLDGAKNLGHFEEEAELARLLLWLADPNHSAALAGVLRGPMFGYTDAQLAEAALVKGGLQPPTPLIELRERLRGLSATEVIETVLFQCEFLKLAQAAPDARDLRAGNLWTWLEIWRAREANGETLTLRGLAHEIQELTFAMLTFGEDIEKQEGRHMRLGSRLAVRIMNLHKAKGLEAAFVLLADPARWKIHKAPRRMVIRRAAGDQVLLSLGPQAMAPHWETHLAEAISADEAERARLLYVASTRAKQALFVFDAQEPKGHWVSLASMAEQGAFKLSAVSPKTEPGSKLKEVQEGLQGLDSRREAWFKPSWQDAIATDLADDVQASVQPQKLHLGANLSIGGPKFGDAMHALFERMVRQRPEGVPVSELPSLTRRLAEEFGLDESKAHTELVHAAEQLRKSPLWQRIQSAKSAWSEYELFVSEGNRVVNGKIDLLLIENDGAVIVDWKSDKKEDDSGHYAAQLEVYARQLKAVGIEVKERMLVYGR